MMSGHTAKFLGGPMDGDLVAYPQERPHPEIRMQKPTQQAFFASADFLNAEAMVEISVERYVLIAKSRANPKLFYYEHVEG